MFSFINLPAVRIKKSKLTHNELINLFKTKENEGKKWETSFFNALYNEDMDRINMLLKEGGITNKSLAMYYIDLLLAYFTEKDYDNNINYFLVKKILLGDKEEKKGFVQSIDVDEEIIKVDTKDGLISATKISAIYPNIKKLFPEIEGKNRYGYCHDFSKRLAKNLNVPCRVATGYVAPLSRKAQYLHSWVEYNREGENWVLDVTRNLFIKRDLYYKLRGVKYPVYKISKETLMADAEMISYLFNHEEWSGKVYFANRPLAIRWYNHLMREEKRRNKEVESSSSIVDHSQEPEK